MRQLQARPGCRVTRPHKHICLRAMAIHRSEVLDNLLIVKLSAPCTHLGRDAEVRMVVSPSLGWLVASPHVIRLRTHPALSAFSYDSLLPALQICIRRSHPQRSTSPLASVCDADHVTRANEALGALITTLVWNKVRANNRRRGRRRNVSIVTIADAALRASSICNGMSASVSCAPGCPE